MVSVESSRVGTPLIPEISTDLVQQTKPKIDIHLPTSRKEVYKCVTKAEKKLTSTYVYVLYTYSISVLGSSIFPGRTRSYKVTVPQQQIAFRQDHPQRPRPERQPKMTPPIFPAPPPPPGKMEEAERRRKRGRGKIQRSPPGGRGGGRDHRQSRPSPRQAAGFGWSWSLPSCSLPGSTSYPSPRSSTPTPQPQIRGGEGTSRLKTTARPMAIFVKWLGNIS